MKTRNGFVSNSSSSSFVVAFPKKPKDAADVWKFMYDSKDGGISVYDYDGLSHSQISSTVFNDIKHGNFKRATLKDLIELFSQRYHYAKNVIWFHGSIPDEDGGRWSEKLGRYFGFNKGLMEELKRLEDRDREEDRKEMAEEHMLIELAGIPEPSIHAYKGGEDPYTHKPYTKSQIAQYDKYCAAMDKFRKTDPAYLAAEKKRWDVHRKRWDKVDELRKRIAKEDAQNFLDDNKGKFIFIVSYGDGNGANGCTMEHGDIFRKVPHIWVSQH
jgi:hypothetical protein